MKESHTIFVHLPAYRDPELEPTVLSALENATYPERLRFGICWQYGPDESLGKLSELLSDPRFKFLKVEHLRSEGLGWARAMINDLLLGDEDFVLQMDSHHRFRSGWDVCLISMIESLEAEGFRPIITGYLPQYSPSVDPEGRVDEPWQQQFISFYPHGTIFIRPGLLSYWNQVERPARSRFMSGHFSFARSAWAREVRHDPGIFFSGEELSLTLRSYTHGWDLFHPHCVVAWHSTMRLEREGVLKWDDDERLGINWGEKQAVGRRRVRALFDTCGGDVDLGSFGLGTQRSLRDYEKYAGIHFQRRLVQRYTAMHCLPPNPNIEDDELWELSFTERHGVGR